MGEGEEEAMTNDRSRTRRCSVAAAGVLALAVLSCASPPPPADTRAAERALRVGVGLYDAGEYVRAAEHFHEAAHGLRGTRARDATAAECVAWLRAQRLHELDTCSHRLAGLVRRDRRSDPGVNTLVALGALAGDRPRPPYRVPREVEPLLREAAEVSP